MNAGVQTNEYVRNVQIRGSETENGKDRAMEGRRERWKTERSAERKRKTDVYKTRPFNNVLQCFECNKLNIYR